MTQMVTPVKRTRNETWQTPVCGTIRLRKRASPQDNAENVYSQIKVLSSPYCGKDAFDVFCKPSASPAVSNQWAEEPTNEEVIECRSLIRASSPCTCGVYFVNDEAGRPISVFKPQNEEHVPEEFAGAIAKGDNLYREHAAYLVSRRLGDLCRVPSNIIARVRHWGLQGGEQRGSLQRFVANACDMSDMGPSGIEDDEVHKVAMLDILVFNLDRHEGNLLVKKTKRGSRVLIPIDHGLCLPRITSPLQEPDQRLIEQISFVWQGWQHSARALSDSSRAFAASMTRDKVDALAHSIADDIPQLPREALTTLRIGAVVLRVCVLAGMTLRETAAYMLQGLGDALARAWRETSALAGDDGTQHYDIWEKNLVRRLESIMCEDVGIDIEAEVAADE